MGYPQIINFNRIFLYKPSVLGYPHSWKPPCGKTTMNEVFFFGKPWVKVSQFFASLPQGESTKTSIEMIEIHRFWSLNNTGWWFGCHFVFSHSVGLLIIPIDFHIFQRGGYTTTNQFLGFWDMIGHRPCSYGKRGYCAMASSPELCYGETSWPPGNQPATRSPRNWGPMNSGDFVFGVPQVFWKHHLAGHIIF